MRVGTTLSASLLTGEVGTAYDAARRQCRETGRRLRLTLSLSAAPELFAIPWELMYHHTGFLGCQRDTPLVRHLAVGEPAPAPAVEQRVRMLVVIASPTDLPGLDTDTEVRIIEAATESVVKADRLEIDWLVGATLPALHQKLRDHSYHLLHVVAHGGPGPDGAGALYLQDARSGSADEVSTATLRTLLDLQRNLRVVVLNSCHGARSGTDDPTRHLVAALIERGVPAVVGMQFPISDRAALTFADEFYRHLIGAQEPIDAAVAAARLAIMVNVDQLEWATPVLYVRDPNVELFRFFVAALVVPPLVEIGRHLTSHHAAPAVTRRVTRLVAARPRGIAPLLVAGAAALGAAAVWADDGPALAGSWRTDAWTQVSASGLDTANPLDSYELQIDPSSDRCVGDACTLDVTFTNNEGSFLATFEPTTTDGGWTTVTDTTWSCIDENGDIVVDNASAGPVTWTLQRDGDDLALRYAYEADTPVPETESCTPVTQAEFITTLHRD